MHLALSAGHCMASGPESPSQLQVFVGLFHLVSIILNWFFAYVRAKNGRCCISVCSYHNSPTTSLSLLLTSISSMMSLILNCCFLFLCSSQWTLDYWCSTASLYCWLSLAHCSCSFHCHSCLLHYSFQRLRRFGLVMQLPIWVGTLRLALSMTWYDTLADASAFYWQLSV